MALEYSIQLQGCYSFHLNDRMSFQATFWSVIDNPVTICAIFVWLLLVNLDTDAVEAFPFVIISPHSIFFYLRNFF